MVGLPYDTWGEVVAAAVVLCPNTTLTAKTLREWCDGRISTYKAPRKLFTVASLPRNAMGKVTKPAVRTLFE